jgi:hypothetical protein
MTSTLERLAKVSPLNRIVARNVSVKKAREMSLMNEELELTRKI